MYPAIGARSNRALRGVSPQPAGLVRPACTSPSIRNGRGPCKPICRCRDVPANPGGGGLIPRVFFSSFLSVLFSRSQSGNASMASEVMMHATVAVASPRVHSAWHSPSEQLETIQGGHGGAARSNSKQAPSMPWQHSLPWPSPDGGSQGKRPGTHARDGRRRRQGKVRRRARENQGENSSQSARPLPCHMGLLPPHPAVSIRHLTWLCPFPQGLPETTTPRFPQASTSAKHGMAWHGAALHPHGTQERTGTGTGTPQAQPRHHPISKSRTHHSRASACPQNQG